MTLHSLFTLDNFSNSILDSEFTEADRKMEISSSIFPQILKLFHFMFETGDPLTRQTICTYQLYITYIHLISWKGEKGKTDFIHSLSYL